MTTDPSRIRAPGQGDGWERGLRRCAGRDRHEPSRCKRGSFPPGSLQATACMPGDSPARVTRRPPGRGDGNRPDGHAAQNKRPMVTGPQPDEDRDVHREWEGNSRRAAGRRRPAKQGPRSRPGGFWSRARSCVYPATRRAAVRSLGVSPVLTVSLGSTSRTSAPSADTGWCRTPLGTT
jgi:hypothetical protein